MHLTLEEIKQACGGQLVGESRSPVIRISTDTRQIQKGDFYVALRGERFDGYDFVDEAFKRGALAALVAHPYPKGPYVLVSDTTKALGDVARFWRDRFSIPVVAITGSCGKTTTKDMIAAVLSQRGPVCSTRGNLNNLIGLPQTIFELESVHQYAVWEMGMNHLGEISRLSEIARPSMGLITNVGSAHLEGLGDMSGVAQAKAELFEALTNKDMAVVNEDDPFIRKMQTRAVRLRYGFSVRAEIQGTIKKDGRLAIKDPSGSSEWEVPFFGSHQAANFLACYAVCIHLGMTHDEIHEGIKTMKIPSMRGEVLSISNGVSVINDAYNANPESMKAALEAMRKRFPDLRRIAVLGEMYELGSQTKILHERLGQLVRESGVELLFAFGPHAGDMVDGFGNGGHSFEDIEELSKTLVQQIQPKDALLIKGSRLSKMERVIDHLRENYS